MNFKKLLALSVIIWGLLACSETNDNDGVQEGVVTYVNLSISLPGKVQGRALPEDYNKDGEYVGKDLPVQVSLQPEV